MKMIERSKWIWMPHPAHFICANDCRFFLSTRIGKYIVSTVGEYFPDAPVREIFAESRGVTLEGMGDARRADYAKKVGFEEIGCGRHYETMVFKSRKSRRKCCPYEITSGLNIDFDGYINSESAYKGHLKMCLRWSKK